MPTVTREPPVPLTIKEWVQRETAIHRMEMQNLIGTCLVYVFIFLIITTVSIILFQGFQIWGFKLDYRFLKWLGAVTVGAVAGLLVIIIKFSFGKERNP